MNRILLLALLASFACKGEAPESVEPTAPAEPAVPAGPAAPAEPAASAKPLVPLPVLSDSTLATLAAAKHLVVATTESWEAKDAEVSLLTLADAGWARTKGPFPAVVGARGLSWGRGLSQPPEGAARIKKEGDKTAPAGLFALGKVIGYDAKPPAGVKLPYEQATKKMVCVDDSKSDAYNSVTSAKGTWKSREKMKRGDHLYEVLALVDHNGLLGKAKPVAGGGSCIFLHVWRAPGKPTVGCTALAEEKLVELLAAIPSLDDVVMVQLPRAEHDAAVAAGWLPRVP